MKSGGHTSHDDFFLRFRPPTLWTRDRTLVVLAGGLGISIWLGRVGFCCGPGMYPSLRCQTVEFSETFLSCAAPAGLKDRVDGTDKDRGENKQHDDR